MSEPIDEQPEYIPDPEKEKQARAVHILVSILRLLGVALVMLGLAIALDRLPPVPVPVGYVLIALGLAQMWVAPIWIIRKYVQARVAEEAIAKAAEGTNKP
jgi:integral membrane sensor domain MASE1